MGKNREHSTVLNRLIRKEPLIHVFFWAIYFIFPVLKSIGPANYPFNLTSQLNDLFFGIAVFYISYLIFLPSKRKSIQIVALLTSLCALAYSNFKVHDWLFHGAHKEVFISYTVSYATTYGILFLFAYALYSVKEIYANQKALEEANQEKKMAELDGLKAQINPHFLFNTLNTIYGSALRKDDRTADLIMKLSDNFRYMLHAGQKDYVPVQNEIDHLKDYVSLQSARMMDKLEVDMTFDIDNNEKSVAPLLMMPFVENAFKYSSTLRGIGHKITINISLKNEELRFYCSNPFEQWSAPAMDNQWEKSGIGILNTQKRLELLYPDRHKLSIEKESDTFIVNLTLSI